jgi:hypothetical protein
MHLLEIAIAAGGALFIGVPWLLARLRPVDSEMSRSFRKLQFIGVVLVAGAVVAAIVTLVRGPASSSSSEPQRDSMGWFIAPSPEGGFDVSVPALFTNFTLFRRDRDGHPTVTHVVDAYPSPNVRFTAQLCVITDGSAGSNELVRRFDNDVAVSATSTLFKTAGYSNMPGLVHLDQVTTPNGPMVAFIRRIRRQDGLFILTVTCPQQEAADVSKPAAYFLESFHTPRRDR